MGDVAEGRLRNLAATARALGKSLPLFQLVELAAESARDGLGAASVSVSRLEPGTVDVHTIVNVGDLGPGEVRWPQGEVYTIPQFVDLDLASDELEVWGTSLGDPAGEPGELLLLRRLEKGSSVSAPIVVDGRLWGEFYATRHLGAPLFDDADRSYLEVLVAILAGAISRALREESLEQLAFQDPLTGLLNRRALAERAPKAFDVPPGAVRSVTVVVVDVNGLKEVNDSCGHMVGDRLIQSVARALDRNFSRFPGALVARVGGDEFSVLVPRHEPSLVVRMADETAALTWDLGPGAGVSVGVATARVTASSTTTADDLFVAADRAQYAAKRGRLTRAVLADEVALEDGRAR